MGVSDAEFEAASRRGEAMKAKYPAAVAVRYDPEISRVVITLSSGQELVFSPDEVLGLENARPADLVDWEISPSGFGVHFPKIDADVYVPALIESLAARAGYGFPPARE